MQILFSHPIHTLPHRLLYLPLATHRPTIDLPSFPLHHIPTNSVTDLTPTVVHLNLLQDQVEINVDERLEDQ